VGSSGAPLTDTDASAWYAKLGPALHRYALMILANRQDAEDAVQQVFLRLVHSRARIRPEAMGAYLRTAVRNESFSVLRHRQRAPDEADDALLEAAGPDSDPDERIALDAALRTLPADQREVVYLKVYEGLTFQEIADLTSESINTVASRWRYAMDKLRAALGVRAS